MGKGIDTRDKKKTAEIASDCSLSCIPETILFDTVFMNPSDASSAGTHVGHDDDEDIPCGPLFAPRFAELNEEERHELWAALALRHTVGLGPRAHGKLLEHFGSALQAVQTACASESGPRLAWEATGIPYSKARSIGSGAWRAAAYEEWQSITQSDAGILLWTNPHYPALLRVIIDPPLFLYCKGDISLLANATISVVGSRLCSREGQKVARTIAKELSRVGVTVVSGMAKGVDSLAHRAALEGVGASIGVLGTGIDVYYPIENKKLFLEMESKGLLLTEFALGTPAKAKNFPARNRIVSGLSLGVVVIEAAARSGSLITARLALEQGHDVYAVPGPSSLQQCRGCHELIRQGAYPVFEAEDILRDLASPLRLRTLEAPKRQRLQKRVAQKIRHSSALEPSTLPSHSEPSIALTLDSLPFDTLQTCPADAPVLSAQPSSTMSPQEDKPLAACHADKRIDSHADMQAEDEAESIMKLLANGEELDMDTLALATGMDTAKVSTLLFVLEMSGKIRRLQGTRFMKVMPKRGTHG